LIRATIVRSLRGFSLIELMVVIAVLGTIVAIALPSYDGLMRRVRLDTTVNELLVALSHARSEAIRRGRRASLCTSIDGQSCAPGVGWDRGWILFDDVNGNGLREGGETIIQVTGARSGRLRVRGNGSVRDYISYLPSGVTRTAAGALQMGTLTVCAGDLARGIVISATGRPRVEAGGAC
jgi:type IV fimbrial biogenesis protein FimT